MVAGVCACVWSRPQAELAIGPQILAALAIMNASILHPARDLLMAKTRILIAVACGCHCIYFEKLYAISTSFNFEV